MSEDPFYQAPAQSSFTLKQRYLESKGDFPGSDILMPWVNMEHKQYPTGQMLLFCYLRVLKWAVAPWL